MIGDCLFYSLTNKGLHFYACICEKQLVCQKAEMYILHLDIFITNKFIVDKLEYNHEYMLSHPYLSVTDDIAKINLTLIWFSIHDSSR